MTTVLVLDANQRSALAVIRSLGNQKDCAILAADDLPIAIGGSSTYCSRYFESPSSANSPLDYLSWLQNLLTQHSVDYIFPVTEITSQLLLMNPTSTGSSQLPFASLETVMALASKDELVKLANSADIKTPNSLFFSCAQEVNPSDIRTYPVVIKPNLSRLWLGDHWLSTTVQIAYSEMELIHYLASSEWLQAHGFMLQEFIPGSGAGLFALYNKGDPIAFFSHKRLREKPPQGGVSVLSESVPLNASLLEPAKRLLSHAHWHGVAMVEFRITPEGTPYLMEVNTRFWGSLQLAIDAGVDFPKMLYQITLGETLTPLNQYSIGVKLRWLLGDLDSLYLVLKSRRYSLTYKISRIFNFLSPSLRTRHEVNRWGDLGPALTELRQYFKNLWS